MMKRPTRRSGGRSARVAMRATPLAENVRPIQGGMNSNAYKPLSDTDILRIHHTALDALEQIGLANTPQSGIDLMVKAGAIFGGEYGL